MKVWCAGCSSGEEAYMLLMLMQEFSASNTVPGMPGYWPPTFPIGLWPPPRPVFTAPSEQTTCRKTLETYICTGWATATGRGINS